MKTNNLFIKQLLLNLRALRASRKNINKIISLFLYAVRLIGRNFGFRFYDTVAIEISNICNARCVWCWMYFSGKKDAGLMSLENFKKIIDLNAGYFKRKNITILPYHRGEPLLHPCFFEMIDYCVKKGVGLRTLST
ncbi:MAG: radical SAM protein, partial [Candidatus Omnitrophica bacterium]|nr:radical SAM protein [Candidatus Omnitrophota bacterium]